MQPDLTESSAYQISTKKFKIPSKIIFFKARWAKSEAFLVLPFIQLSLVSAAVWTSMTR
jgi:hypothetical protein